MQGKQYGMYFKGDIQKWPLTWCLVPRFSLEVRALLLALHDQYPPLREVYDGHTPT